MADIIPIASRAPIRKAFVPKLTGGDELATIGNPELVLSNALAQLRAAAMLLCSIKPGESGERDALDEIFAVFRGPAWEAMVKGGQDDGA
jgi:hypothetical protein